MTDAQTPATEEKTEDKKPTAEQVKTANELERAKWEGDFKEEELTIPYKPQAEEEEEAKPGENEPAEEEEPETPSDEYDEPAPLVTTQDPGAYQPADYSFQVTLKDGKSVTVKTPEEADTIAQDADNFTTPKQLLDFIRQAQKMENNLERDRENWQKQKEEFDKQSEAETQRLETINTFASEFQYLVGKGLLPPVAKEYLTANWEDPDVAKQSGVKEQLALLDYMVKENEVRAKAKVKPITSIVDAFNAWQLDNERKQGETERKAAGEARKAAGSRVASVSASNQAPYVPKGIAVGNPNILKRNQAVWED